MNDNDRSYRVSFSLSQNEVCALSRLGKQYRRGFRSQAYFSMKQNLIDLGLIPGENQKTNKSKQKNGDNKK